MKILVTGCCGFIGSHLCEKLLKSKCLKFFLLFFPILTIEPRCIKNEPSPSRQITSCFVLVETPNESTEL